MAECEANQAEWNAAVALAGGGKIWEEDGLRWAWHRHSDRLMLSFPRSIDPAAAARGVEFAREQNCCMVGAWLSTDTDAAPLEAIGFERGWEPWWMAADLAAVSEPDDERVTLSAEVPEYGPGGQALLSLARGESPRAWHAVARADGRFAGRAWCFLAGDVAGVYDMEVWPDFQQQGLGRALLRAVCAPARGAGATRAVLNSTPAGKALYASEGFVRVGEGITYWHHGRVAPADARR